MRTAAGWWGRVWFQPFDPFSVGLFRIALGILISVMFIALVPNWERYYAADGLLSLHDPALPRLAEDWWSVFRWTEGLVPIRAWWGVGFLAALAFTVGWQTRAATVTLYVLQTSMIHRNWMLVNGDDLVFRMLLFYGCFAPLGASLSVDRWLRRRRAARVPASPHPTQPLIWPVRLMQINTALIYLTSLPLKLADPSGEWLRGDAIYWAMMSTTWGRWPGAPLFYAHGALISKLATYGTVVVEGAFPFLVWFRPYRPYVLTAITALHLGIAVAIPGVTFFTLSMVCAFLLFVPGETSRRWYLRIRGVLAI